MKTEPAPVRFREGLGRESAERPRPGSAKVRARHNDEMVDDFLRCLPDELRESCVGAPETSGHHSVVGGA